MKKYLALFVVCFALTGLLVSQNTLAVDYACPFPTADECLTWSLNQTGTNAGYSQSDSSSASIAESVGKIISYVLALLGIFFLVNTIYSGIQWMTAGGNEEKVKQAQARIFNAIIGLIIVMSAYAITFFVVNKLKNTIETSDANQACTALSGECQTNAIVNGPCIVNSSLGYYQPNLCPGTDPTLLCCVPVSP